MGELSFFFEHTMFPLGVLISALLLSWTGWITDRLKALVFVIVFGSYAVLDLWLRRSFGWLVADGFFLAWCLMDVFRGGPWWGPRMKRLAKAVGAKARAILEKIKASMPVAKSPLPAVA